MTLNRFIYPRTITITRPHTQLAPEGGISGGQASQLDSTGRYWAPAVEQAGDDELAGEDVVFTALPCSIQGSSGRTTGQGELPSHAPGPTLWTIFIPLSACPMDSLQSRDIVTDDQGWRYQVSAPYWNSLGYKLETVRLENG